MPKNDQEVFSFLIGQNGPYEINLLTYALYADERANWIEHFTAQNTSEPTDRQLEHWVSNLTAQNFAHMQLRAAQFFDQAAREYLQSEIESEKKAALEGGIITNIKATGAFWRQMTIALITSVLAPILIGAILYFLFAYNKVFPTFIQIPAEIARPTSPGS